MKVVGVPPFGGVGAPDNIPDLNNSTVNSQVDFVTKVRDADEDAIDPSASGIGFIVAPGIGNEPETEFTEFEY